MKKSTIILIVIIYISSILVISLFGMKMSVYNEFIPVSAILCLNNTDENIERIDSEDNIIIKIKFTSPYDINSGKGTKFQIYWRVMPDNATIKNVKFLYDESNSRLEFYKTEDGEYTGLVLFYNKTISTVKISSTDGRKVYTTITLWAYWFGKIWHK